MASTNADQEESAPTESVSEPEPPVKVQKWNAVANWSWTPSVETCAICKNNFMSLCIACEADEEKIRLEKASRTDHSSTTTTSPVSNVCDLVWGKCNHCFHRHCMNKLLQGRGNHCPLDMQEWEEQKPIMGN
eukprot:TRINITY_DN4194_c0_g1_i1.p1 TRINITY_DN4194_c0_g1~~TRINITY_DN4194_c0_g1_i1.p1  ORF type:complete len:149 (-),score=26.38 TRINITY_DN4194_c0_g1_i1:3-398(-)